MKVLLLCTANSGRSAPRTPSQAFDAASNDFEPAIATVTGPLLVPVLIALVGVALCLKRRGFDPANASAKQE